MVARKYNPGFLSDTELVESFCVRLNEFQSLIDALRECTGTSNQHQIVIGPRGSGKTSLLLRVAVEVRTDPDLAERFFPVIFAEESYEVATAGEFWLECLSRLAQQVPHTESEPDLLRTCEELRTLRDDRGLGERCLGALQDFSDRQGKRLVLIVENLNMMVRDMTDRHAGWRLRQTLQTDPRILLLASATSRFDEIDDPDHAFYDLFRELRLRPLDLDACATLWQNVSGQQRAPQTIQALRILTGGSPRLLTIVARFGEKLSFRELMADLLDLVDDHTEYFKSHLDALPAQERRVYLALADLWKPATTREIAERSRVEVNKCSAHLGRLTERGAVEVTGGTARRKLYYLTERLYNIYYLMRRSRGPAPMIEALIHFMEAYYSPDELKDLAVRIAHEAMDLGTKMQVAYRTAFERLLDTPTLANHRDELLSRTPPTFHDQLKAGANTTAVPTRAEALSARAFAFVRADRLPEALDTWKEVVGRFGGSRKSTDREQVAIALINQGVTLGQLNQHEEAMAAWSEVMQRFDKSVVPALLDSVLRAMVNKGAMLAGLDRLSDALAVWNEVEQRFGTSDREGVLELLATALTCKGVTLIQLDRPEDGLSAWDEVVQRYGRSKIPGVLAQVATALVSKGVYLAHANRQEEALTVWDEVSRRFAKHDAPVVLQLVVIALRHKSQALAEWDRLEEAIDACDAIIARFGGSESPEVLDAVAEALVNKGTGLARLERMEDAIHAWDDVLRRFGTSHAPSHLNAVVRALADKAKALADLNRPEDSLRAWDEIVQRFGTSDTPELFQAAAKALVNMGAMLAQANRRDEAINSFDEVVRRLGASDSSASHETVARALVGRGLALAESNRPDEALEAWDEVVRRFGASDSPALLETVARTMANKGAVLAESNRHEEAVTAWDEVIQRYGTSEAPKIVETVAGAMVNRGAALAESNRHEEAIKAWENVQRRFDGSAAPALLNAIAGAMVNKGNALYGLNRTEEALDTLNEIVARFQNTSELADPDPVAISLTNISTILDNLGRLDEAIDVCDEIAQRFGASAAPTHRNTTEMSLLRKADIELARGRAKPALEAVEKLLEREFAVAPVHQLLGQLTHARASLELSDIAACTRDVTAALEALPTLDSLPSGVLENLVVLAADLGTEQLHDLIEASPAADLLLPFSIALQRELGKEPRVAKEVEDVAEDIRRDLARYRKARKS